MSWVRLDDRIWSDEKLNALSPWAHRQWVRGLAYASAHQSDGLLTASAIKMLGVSPKQLRELVEIGLWLKSGTGVQIKNYLEYQPSRAEVTAKRKAAAERIKRFRDRQSNAVTNATETHSSNENVTLPPSHPIPSPTPSTRERAPARTGGTFGDIPVSSWAGPSPLSGHDKTARDVGANLGLEHKRFVAHHGGEGTLRRAEQWDSKFTKWLLDSPNFKRRGAEDPPGATEHAGRKAEAWKNDSRAQVWK